MNSLLFVEGTFVCENNIILASNLRLVFTQFVCNYFRKQQPNNNIKMVKIYHIWTICTVGENAHLKEYFNNALDLWNKRNNKHKHTDCIQMIISFFRRKKAAHSRQVVTLSKVNSNSWVLVAVSLETFHRGGQNDIPTRSKWNGTARTNVLTTHSCFKWFQFEFQISP